MISWLPDINYYIQGFLIVIIIGVSYNLMMTTRAYGGVTGAAIRLIGAGILSFSIAMIERALVNFAIIQSSINTSLTQDILSMLGLIFVGLGFSKLVSSVKSKI